MIVGCSITEILDYQTKMVMRDNASISHQLKVLSMKSIIGGIFQVYKYLPGIRYIVSPIDL